MKTSNKETVNHTSIDNWSDAKYDGLHLNEKGTAILCKSFKVAMSVKYRGPLTKPRYLR